MRTPVFAGRVDAQASLTLEPREAAARKRWLQTLAGQRVEVVVRPWKAQRTGAQNRRYWALLTVGAESLGWDDVEGLHEAIAQKLLPLPPCPKTGLPRRERTPRLNTTRFARYTEDAARLLVEFGADLTGWDEEERRLAELLADEK